MRVVFLGPAVTTGAHAVHRPVGNVQPVFLDARPAADPAALRAAVARAAPDVVVVLAPDTLPVGTLDGVRAATLEVGGARWHGRPLPIDDRLFADVRPWRHPPRALFLGRSTEHREALLIASKHEHDVVHYAYGLAGESLRAVLAETDVGIALNPTAEPGLPAQALLHLAAGQLLVSERLDPACGLEAGVDYLDVASPVDLVTRLHEVRARPSAYDDVRARGRLKAEAHRASLVWPRLLEDVAAYGAADTLTV
jgi:hypothetical protein